MTVLACALALGPAGRQAIAAPALASPSPGNAVQRCFDTATTPTLCDLERDAGSPSMLTVAGAGFTPGATAVLTMTTVLPALLSQPGTGLADSTAYTATVQTGLDGRVAASVFHYCEPAQATITAADPGTHRVSRVVHPPACSDYSSNVLSAERLVVPGGLAAPEVCDFEATTPNVCHTGFDGTATSPGAVIVDGTGYQANERVHVSLSGGQYGTLDFEATADGDGVLDAASIQQVACSTLDASVTVADTMRHVVVHGAAAAPCYTLPSVGGSYAGGNTGYSSNGNVPWPATGVPVGALVIGLAALRRRGRRGSRRGRPVATVRARILDANTAFYAGMDDTVDPLIVLERGQEIFTVEVIDDAAMWRPVKLPNGSFGYIPYSAPLFTCHPGRLLSEATLYDQPGSGELIVRRLERGTTLMLVGESQQESGLWYAVRIDATTEGYLPPDAAVQFGQAQIRPNSTARLQRANRDLLVGGLWCVGGAVVTAATYEAAASGGTYVVAWGAIVFGGYQFLRGLVARLSESA